jgi:hypothetical protein
MIPDLPPENGSSGRAQVSWPLAFGGMSLEEEMDKNNADR